MRSLLIAAAMASALISTSIAALAGPTAGTTLQGIMSSSVDTKSAYVGKTVVLTNVSSSDGSGAVSGGKIYGHVTKVVRAGQGRPAQLQIRFDRLTFPSGSSYAVDGIVTGIHANTKNNTIKEAAGALGGMLIGNALGKTILHTGGGGLLGAAGGFLIAKNNRENMSVPAGSVVKVKLLGARRQARHY